MLETGTRIGKYRIAQKIGAGGMADVYQAEDTLMGRQVAMKVLPPEFARDPERVARFQKEVRNLAALDHPNIVSIYDVGRDRGYHYYTMVLLAGSDLKQRIDEGFSHDIALEILKKTASALGYAHKKGLIHRDIKPENIMFDEQNQPFLTDLGIAKAIGSGTRMTATGMSIGTPHYMSPEQARGQQVDGRSDLYSLGVVFFEMLTGQVPFDASDTFAVGLMHINEPVPELPGPFFNYQPIIDRLLAKNPDDRFSDAGRLLEALEKVQSGRVLSRPAHATQAMHRADILADTSHSKKSGLFWGLNGALAALMIGAGIYFYTQEPMRVAPTGGGNYQAGSSKIISRSETGAKSHSGEKTYYEKELAAVAPSKTPISSQKVSVTENLSVDSAETSRQEEIKRLLFLAEKDLQATRLTTPEGSNAFERYQAVLEIDSGNAKASQGLARIVSKYIELNDVSVKKNDFFRAEKYLTKAGAIIPNSQVVALARKRLEVAKKKYAEKEKEVAIGQGNRNHRKNKERIEIEQKSSKKDTKIEVDKNQTAKKLIKKRIMIKEGYYKTVRTDGHWKKSNSSLLGGAQWVPGKVKKVWVEPIYEEITIDLNDFQQEK